MVADKQPVGAHYGLKDWLVQRLSALVMVGSVAVFMVAWWVVCPNDYVSWSAFIGLIGIRITLLLFIFALVAHAFIGMRDIFMDYIKFNGLRLFKVAGVFVYLLICLIWAMVILF